MTRSVLYPDGRKFFMASVGLGQAPLASLQARQEILANLYATKAQLDQYDAFVAAVPAAQQMAYFGSVDSENFSTWQYSIEGPNRQNLAMLLTRYSSPQPTDWLIATADEMASWDDLKKALYAALTLIAQHAPAGGGAPVTPPYAPAPTKNVVQGAVLIGGSALVVGIIGVLLGR